MIRLTHFTEHRSDGILTARPGEIISTGFNWHRKAGRVKTSYQFCGHPNTERSWQMRFRGDQFREPSVEAVAAPPISSVSYGNHGMTRAALHRGDRTPPVSNPAPDSPVIQEILNLDPHIIAHFLNPFFCLHI